MIWNYKCCLLQFIAYVQKEYPLYLQLRTASLRAPSLKKIHPIFTSWKWKAIPGQHTEISIKSTINIHKPPKNSWLSHGETSQTHSNYQCFKRSCKTHLDNQYPKNASCKPITSATKQDVLDGEGRLIYVCVSMYIYIYIYIPYLDPPNTSK